MKRLSAIIAMTIIGTLAISCKDKSDIEPKVQSTSSAKKNRPKIGKPEIVSIQEDTISRNSFESRNFKNTYSISSKFSNSAKALQPIEVEQILTQASLYLFTNPENCPACHELEEELSKSGQENTVTITYQGKAYELPIKRMDPWGDSYNAQQDEFAKLGYLAIGIPQFSIVVGDKPFGADFFNKKTNDLYQSLLQQKELFLPLTNESYTNYNKRINGIFDSVKDTKDNVKLDLSLDVLSALGIGERILKPNPTFTPAVNKNNILIIGTADIPSANPVFTGITIKKVVSSLDKISKVKPVILYGSGKDDVCDTCQVKPGGKISEDPYTYGQQEREFVKFQLNADESPSKENIVSYFNELNRNYAKNNLMVLIGHGTPTGFPVWLDLTEELTPDDMAELHMRSQANNILVSGNCYGGIMATKVSCAFTAANPKTTAAGCWEDAETGKDLPDYVSVFFKSLNDKTADNNKDGQISFSEAHAYALLNGSDEDKPYTSIDALADKYFEEHKGDLPDSVHSSYLKSVLIEKYASLDEKIVLDKLMNDAGAVFTINFSKQIKKNVDLGVVSADYTYDPMSDEHTFTNIQIKDSKPILEYQGSTGEVKVKDIDFYMDSGSDKNELILIYTTSDAEKDRSYGMDLDSNKLTEFKPMNRTLMTLTKRLVYKSKIKHSSLELSELEKISTCENQSVETFLNK